MEKWKSENALLKAELNVKTLSDHKRRLEEELQSMFTSSRTQTCNPSMAFGNSQNHLGGH